MTHDTYTYIYIELHLSGS